jgi:hypothetical protein
MADWFSSGSCQDPRISHEPAPARVLVRQMSPRGTYRTPTAVFDISFPSYQFRRILRRQKGQAGRNACRKPDSGTDALLSRRKTAFRQNLFFERGSHENCRSRDRPECASYEPPAGTLPSRRLPRDFDRHLNSEAHAMLYWAIQLANPVKPPIARGKNP